MEIAVPPAQSTDQIQQQETAGKVGALTRTELNVLQTMLAIITCFIICWSPASLASIFQTIRVCRFYIQKQNLNN